MNNENGPQDAAAAATALGESVPEEVIETIARRENVRDEASEMRVNLAKAHAIHLLNAYFGTCALARSGCRSGIVPYARLQDWDCPSTDPNIFAMHGA